MSIRKMNEFNEESKFLSHFLPITLRNDGLLTN